MSQLESSFVLENRLKNIDCSTNLKVEIIKYIDNEHKICTGTPMSISNVMYRCNLHYIENNIHKDGLIEELQGIK